MAGDSSIDAFLELKLDGGKRIEGESQDGEFAPKKAIEILSFSMGFEKDDYEEVDEFDPGEQQKALLKVQTATKSGGGAPGPTAVSVTVPAKKRKRKKKAPYSFRTTKLVDSSSSTLFYLYCQFLQRPIDASGKVVEDSSATIKEARITFRKGGGQQVKYLRMYFANLLVVDFKVGVSDGHPTEEVVFGFNKFELTYDSQASTGTKATDPGKILCGWDFGENVDWTHGSDGN